MLPPEFELHCQSTAIVPKFSGFHVNVQKSESFQKLVQNLKYDENDVNLPALEEILSTTSENVELVLKDGIEDGESFKNVCYLQKRLLESFESVKKLAVERDDANVNESLELAIKLTEKQRELFGSCPGIARPNAIGGVPIQNQRDNVEKLLDFSKNTFDINFQKSRLSGENRFLAHNHSMNQKIVAPDFSIDLDNITESLDAPADFVQVILRKLTIFENFTLVTQ